MIIRIAILSMALCLGACGVAYISPDVREDSVNGNFVRVVPITPDTVRVANQSAYRPDTLPAIFAQTTATGSRRAPDGSLPTPSNGPQNGQPVMELRVPPTPPTEPYRVGVDDILVLATRAPGNSVEELSGLLASQNRRQEYRVQDDGSISIPDVGRVRIVGQTIDEAEATIFNALVEAQIDPAFSLEVAQFNSRRVSVGGAVGTPGVQTIGLSPLLLNEALSAAGGVRVQDIDFASIRLYRDGQLYQIPLMELYSRRSLQRIPLAAGDSLFVDTDYRLDRAETYFREQIQLSDARRDDRLAALSELETEVDLRRAQLNEARDNFLTQIQLDAVDRDYVYLTGEVTRQRRMVMPFNQTVSLADALFQEGGFLTEFGNPSQVYVLRGSSNPRDNAAVTAWQLNGRDATSFLLATRFELRPNDVLFVAEQPITRWSRVVSQLTPSVFTQPVIAAVQ
ncbi:polysaccharide biosynthesis/export family protein [Oceanomicrobium pacificus]|uniref:Sugar transporter n=1 Tax=Oceanomicrobium pacificus TaxID=2692916 RepID=A0A6B0TV97_9RHOB|nr:polysaccharide biosynthesis/export family protein [Oceanomicrobium pacificus]MXU65064.1 sugar transporter [Oceanomicrobium pacificus]